MRRFVACLLACAALAVVVAGSALADPGDSADLGVSVKADAKSYTVGDLVTYTLTVTNVASVDSANPDQNEAGNNYALSSVAVAA